MASIPENPIQYGRASLPDLLGSVAAALGAPRRNVLAIEPCDRAVLVVVDGLGWSALRADLDAAPFLAGLTGRSLTAGFPTTTATSLASIGTGLPPGEHGITGYTTVLADLPEVTEPINWLRWAGARTGTDLRAIAVPEQVQPHPTMFEQARQHGIGTSVVAAGDTRSSGLTRAVLRGASYRAAATLAGTVAAAAAAVRGRPPQLTYAYIADQDLVGHQHGPSSDAWRMQLTLVDKTLELLAARLPAGTRLLVTADHGMVDVPDDAKIDYDHAPELRDGVAHLAGEGRARVIHVVPGQLAAVRARWAGRLGDSVHVIGSADMIAAGWLGPAVSGRARARAGDLVAVSADRATVVRRGAEHYLAAMRGQHGALTDEELLVPLLTLTC